jgi:hypothetical protein
MSIELSREIWDELKRYINVVDREEAAEIMVSVLIDNDASAEEIKDTFKGDAEIRRAVATYLEDHSEPDDDDDDNDAFEYDNEDDEDY